MGTGEIIAVLFGVCAICSLLAAIYQFTQYLKYKRRKFTDEAEGSYQLFTRFGVAAIVFTLLPIVTELMG